MTKILDQLAETHSSVMALLESRIISPATRRRLEQYRDKLEREMAEARVNQPPPGHDVAA